MSEIGWDGDFAISDCKIPSRAQMADCLFAGDSPDSVWEIHRGADDYSSDAVQGVGAKAIVPLPKRGASTRTERGPISQTASGKLRSRNIFQSVIGNFALSQEQNELLFPCGETPPRSPTHEKNSPPIWEFAIAQIPSGPLSVAKQTFLHAKGQTASGRSPIIDPGPLPLNWTYPSPGQVSRPVNEEPKRPRGDHAPQPAGDEIAVLDAESAEVLGRIRGML